MYRFRSEQRLEKKIVLTKEANRFFLKKIIKADFFVKYYI